MGVASGCGQQEAGVASGSGWNLWVWLLGVVVRRYIDFLILLIPTPLLYLFFFAAASLLFVHFFNVFRSCSSTFLQLHFMYDFFFSRNTHTRPVRWSTSGGVLFLSSEPVYTCTLYVMLRMHHLA